MGDIIAQLLRIAAPFVLQAVAEHKAANSGEIPTIAQLEARLDLSIAGFLAEGARWTAAHPAEPGPDGHP